MFVFALLYFALLPHIDVRPPYPFFKKYFSSSSSFAFQLLESFDHHITHKDNGRHGSCKLQSYLIQSRLLDTAGLDLFTTATKRDIPLARPRRRIHVGIHRDANAFISTERERHETCATFPPSLLLSNSLNKNNRSLKEIRKRITCLASSNILVENIIIIMSLCLCLPEKVIRKATRNNED